MRFTIGLIFFLAASLAQAEANFSAGLGADYTDNANLASEDKRGDLVLSAKAQASARNEQNEFGLRLNYRDYSKENTNDNLSWRIYDQYKPLPDSWYYLGALSGRQYSNGSPGVTDSSYSNMGWELKAAKNRNLNGLGELIYGSGLRGRYYSDSGKRSDHQLFGFVEFDREQSLKLQFGGASELSYLFSSDSLYNQVGIDFSGYLDYSIEADLIWHNELAMTTNSFTSRTVDVTTTTSKNRGGTRTNTLTQNEFFSNVSFTSEVIKKFDTNTDGQLGITATNQSSKSGSLDYAVNEIYMSLTQRF